MNLKDYREYPFEKESFPQDLATLKANAIAAIDDFLDGDANLSLKLFRIVYYFFPYKFGNSEDAGLRAYIYGYANDRVVTEAVNQLKKIADYFYSLEHGNKDVPAELKDEFLRKATLILIILKKWILAQSDSENTTINDIVQITDIDVTTEQILEALGYRLSAFFHLISVNYKRDKPLMLNFGGQTYDLNYTPDMAVKIAEIFAYLMWLERGDSFSTVETYLTFYRPTINYNEFTQQWWNEKEKLRQEYEKLNNKDPSKAFKAWKVILFHQEIDYISEMLIGLHTSSSFRDKMIMEFALKLSTTPLAKSGFFSRRTMLVRLYKDLLGRDCTDEFMDKVEEAINTFKN